MREECTCARERSACTHKRERERERERDRERHRETQRERGGMQLEMQLEMAKIEVGRDTYSRNIRDEKSDFLELEA